MAACVGEDDAPRSDPIAIVGMGCRWPGGVRDAPGLWELLARKGSGYREFGPHRFSIDGFYHPASDRPGTVSTRGGYLLDEDPRLFDPSFFGIQPLEVETMDVAQRKLLEVVYEAFESAGETLESMSGSRTGVYVGYMASDHLVMQNRDPDHPRPYKATGISPCIASNRISYTFNLTGPSVTVDTACSSSMYALHMAVKAITNGDCGSAIVAAANWIGDPCTQITLNKLGALSETSTCHSFDVSADGYARGEGFGALYLRKAQVAANEGSVIRAIIRGTAINANGRTGGITHPGKTAQEAVIRKAYQDAGNLPLSETAYFECHGTGTPVGDPIEIAVIGQVFSSVKTPENPLLVGSVKTNLGHSEPTSGIAGIMKVVLALEEGVIPPSIGVETLNPEIDFDKAKVRVLTEMTPWPAGQVRRASINSFGFGGANGHCIIEHVNCLLPDYVNPGIIKGPGFRSANGHATNGRATNGNGHLSNGNGAVHDRANGRKLALSHVPVSQKPKSLRSAKAKTRKLVLLPFSAHNEASLKLNIAALASVLNKHLLADIAYTLAAKRTKFSQRTFRIVNNVDDLGGMNTERQIYSIPSETARLGFIFTGQGAQWHGMGRELFEYRTFTDAIQYLDYVVSVLRADTNAPYASWTIEDVLTGNCSKDLVNSPEVSQVVCTALQIGLVDLLASWSIRATGVVGHSSGEIAAAYAAGYITAPEAIAAAYFRGQAVSRNTRQGAMLAVGLGVDEALARVEQQGLSGQVKAAAINSPRSVTLSGDVEAVKTLSAHLETEGVFNRILKTGGNAYHSHHMATLGGEYQDMLSAGSARLREMGLCNPDLRYPQISWVSSVSPSRTSKAASETGPSYWRSNLEEPVRFSDALTTLVALTDRETLPVNMLVEIGPHHALKGPVDQILKGLSKATTRYTHSLKRDEDGQSSILQLAGTLFGLNYPVDLAAVNSTDDEMATGHVLVQGCTVADLPPYQYSYGPVSYHESRLSKEYRLRSVARHDLLGSKLPGSAKLRPQWRNILRVKDLSWLREHRWMTEPVFPAAGFVAMAVEASSRVHQELVDAPEAIGFSLRNMSINTALIIPEDDYGVEVVLSMEFVDAPTTKSPSTWASFSVSSVVGDPSVWTEHCTGQIKAEISSSTEHRIEKIATQEMDPRMVESAPWYNKYPVMRYGPPFRVLSGMHADPIKKLSTARVGLKTTTGIVKGGESHYPIHPTSIDGLLQLGMISCQGGQIETVESALMPVHISNLYLRNSRNDDDWALAIASGELRGLRGAYAQVQLRDQCDQLLLDISSVRYTRHMDESHYIEKANQRAPFSSPFARLEWKPDIRTMTACQALKVFPPPQENSSRQSLLDSMQAIATLIVTDIYETFAGRQDLATVMSDRINPFLAWVRRRVEHEDTPLMAKSKQLSVHERLKWLKELYDMTEGQIDTKIAKVLHQNMEDILYERRNGVEILKEHGLYEDLYESGLFLTSAYAQLLRVLKCLGHANPDQNILELGAGTGGATQVAMRALTNAGDRNIKQYSGYTFTDISPDFVASARESMSTFRDMSFSVLDITKDPVEQGYGPVYDTIIASHCLHATPNVQETLSNCRKLLKPGGKLVLVEITEDAISPGLLQVMGTLPGYWNGLDDERVDSPFLDLAKWDSSLLDAGFSGNELALPDFTDSDVFANTILSTLRTTKGSDDQSLLNGVPVSLHTENSNGTAQVVHLLHGASGPPALLDSISQELRRREVATSVLLLDDAVEEVTQGAHVIAFLDGENLLLDPEASRLAIFQHLARNSSTMIWITSCGMNQGNNPDGAVVTGLLRTLGTENPAARFMAVDVDPENAARVEGAGEDTADLVRCIVDKEITLQGGNDDEVRDREFVWQQGCMWVSRLVPDVKLADQCDLIKMPASRAELAPLGSQGPVRADFEKPGILTSLYFKPYRELWKPILPGELEVKVAAVGLNWKDLGTTTGRWDAHNLSHEYSGVVTALGSAVEGFSVGDRVYGMGRGHFGNYTRVPANLAQKLGPADDLVEMATMPLVFMTAIYAFDHVTQLKAGEKVLIQSASGGLGLAAIQVAQARGAEVFATVGTADKARFLAETTSIPESHIFGSREVAELHRAVAATKGRGFDVILSTSKGDMLYESLKALHPLGRLIDVGRLDVRDARSIGLEVFQRSISFSSFDLSQVVDVDPELGASLIKAVDRYYRAGNFGHIKPFTASDVSQLDQALLQFSKGTHVGKLVVTFLNPDTMVRMVPPIAAAQFDTHATYIVTGGWGNLGRATIRWMADRGARNIAVLSRSGSCAAAAQVVKDDLAAHGTTVTPFACDVGVREQVFDVIQELSSKGQIKGLIHTAMAPEDFSFDTLSIEQWQRSLSAKVAGTRNLHDATAVLPLDFFVMATSLVTKIPFATQSAYTAANNFQEAFARYRHRLGLPASAVSFGLVRGVGFLGNNPTTLGTMMRNKVLTLSEHQFLEYLESGFLGENHGGSGMADSKGNLDYDPLSRAEIHTCLDPARLAAQRREEETSGTAPGPTPRWYRDGRLSTIVRAFDDAYRHLNDEDAAAGPQKNEASRGGSAAVARLRDEFDKAIKNGGAEERSSTQALVASAIVTTVAEMLAMDASGVSEMKSVTDYGVDSLVAAELRNWFNVTFRTNIPRLDLLDPQTTIKSLAGIVVDKALESQLDGKTSG